MLTDTHAHLCDGVFDADRSGVLDRAAAAGVTEADVRAVVVENTRRLYGG